MSELVPGTPEYQEAYDKEMKRLEAEAEKPAATTSEAKVEEKVEKTAPEDKAGAPKKDESEDLKAELEKTRKALEDTKRWGHGLAAKVSKIEKDREQEKHAAKRPAILDANPGLEDAIKHVSAVPEAKAPEQDWTQQVAKAIPDVDALLGDPAFYGRAKARREEMGAEWDDPLIAIRELSSLKTAHLSQKAAAAATDQARKDFEAKAKKRDAMKVPGGSGGKDTVNETKTDDAVERYRTMSTEEFSRERSRVMGY